MVSILQNFVFLDILCTLTNSSSNIQAKDLALGKLKFLKI
jgi:hypothetical protein